MALHRHADKRVNVTCGTVKIILNVVLIFKFLQENRPKKNR